MAKELGMLFIFLWGYNNKQTKKKKNHTTHTEENIWYRYIWHSNPKISDCSQNMFIDSWARLNTVMKGVLIIDQMQ